jgi:long-subunit acyl-CoA synthetase (AMP-forming)
MYRYSTGVCTMSSFVCLYSAAAPISADVLEYFLSLDIKIWEIYGMSEIRYQYGYLKG